MTKHAKYPFSWIHRLGFQTVLHFSLILNFPSRCSAVLEVPVQLIFYLFCLLILSVMVDIKRLVAGGGRGDITLCVTRTGSGGKRRGWAATRSRRFPVPPQRHLCTGRVAPVWPPCSSVVCGPQSGPGHSSATSTVSKFQSNLKNYDVHHFCRFR